MAHHHRAARLARAGAADPLAGAGDARGAVCEARDRSTARRALRIIFLEMMPNLLPFLGANLVVAVAQAVLASIGLEALGLGTPSEPTLGMTIYWLMNESAFLLGLWWWIIAPIASSSSCSSACSCSPQALTNSPTPACVARSA